MKLKKRDIQVLLGVFSLVLLFLAYQFGFLKLKESTDVLVSENEQLSAQVTELEGLTSKKKTFIADAEKFQTQIEEIKAKFPANFKVEDGIMLAVELEQKTGLTTTSIQVDPGVMVFEQGKGLVGEGATAQPAAEAAPAAEGEEGAEAPAEGAEEVSTGVVLYNVPFNLGFEVSNKQLKDSLKIIQEYRDRKVLKSLSVTYNNETGILTGNTNVNIYVITGTDKAYVPPKVPHVSQATDNIFGTVELPKKPTSAALGETN